MKIAIIGFGSIGQRHVKNFKQLGAEVAVVSRRPAEGSDLNISECQSRFKPDIYFICNATSDHFAALMELKNNSFKGIVIVEKPLFHKELDFDVTCFKDVRVAYNFRFHEQIQNIKAELKNQKIISVVAYVGQYLPQWRPQADYRNTYSAKVESGGGVLLDLSHELDLVAYLVGPIKSVYAEGGKLSNLEITSEDMVHLLLQSESLASLNVHLNYLDREKKRFIVINTLEKTLQADLTLSSDTYLDMAKDILHNEAKGLCSFAEAQKTLSLIGAARKSMQKHQRETL